MERCCISGESHPRKDLLPYGEQWVLPEHKSELVQRLAESAEQSSSDSNDKGLRAAKLGAILIGIGVTFINISVFGGFHFYPSDIFVFCITTLLPISMVMAVVGGVFTFLAVARHRYFSRWHFYFTASIPLICLPWWQVSLMNLIWVLALLLKNYANYLPLLKSKKQE